MQRWRRRTTPFHPRAGSLELLELHSCEKEIIRQENIVEGVNAPGCQKAPDAKQGKIQHVKKVKNAKSVGNC